MEKYIPCKWEAKESWSSNPPSEWEKIIANETTDKGLISKIYKQLTQLNDRKIKQPNKKSGKKTQTFLQRKHTWLTNT